MRDSGGPHARQLPHSIFDRVVVGGGRAWRQVQRQDVLGRHARVDAFEPHHFAKHERRADREEKGQRDFQHHQAVPDRAVSPSHRRAACFLGDVVHVHPRRGQRGREAEHHRRGDARRQQERERGPVERDLVRPGDARRRHRHQQPGAPPGDGRADRAAGQRQHQALGQELPGQSGRTGPERRARHDFAAADAHPREQQVRHAGAGRGEDQADGGEQHPERLPHRRNDDVAEREDMDVDSDIRGCGPGAILGFDLRGDDPQLRPGRLQRYAAAQAADRLQPPAPHRRRRRQARLPHRYPHVGSRLRRRALHQRSRSIGKLEPRGHDADDRERPVVERHDAADDRSIALEAVVPQPRADHRDVVSIVGPEGPAFDRVDAQHREGLAVERSRGEPFQSGGSAAAGAS